MNTIFTKEENELLEKGLNYSFINNSKTNIKSLIAHTDSILNYISRNHNNNLDYNKFIKIFKNCNLSVSGVKRSVLSSIKHKMRTGNLLISKADKGNCLVIQNRSAYIEKTSSFIHSNGFTVLSKDPTTTYHNKLKLAIKNLHPNFIEQFNINPSHFIPSNPLPPRLYCLPKIHKPEIPYRAIVSSVGSNTHHLSVFLSKQLPSILEFKPNFSIKNSIMLCNELSGVSLRIPRFSFRLA